MGAEGGLGGMTAIPMAVAKQRVKPAVGLTSGRKVVDQLDMPIAVAQLVDAAPPLTSEQRDTLALLLRGPRRG